MREKLTEKEKAESGIELNENQIKEAIKLYLKQQNLELTSNLNVLIGADWFAIEVYALPFTPSPAETQVSAPIKLDSSKVAELQKQVEDLIKENERLKVYIEKLFSLWTHGQDSAIDALFTEIKTSGEQGGNAKP
jgi:hypothetical protein